MASLSVKFQSSTCTLISFSHNWKIKLAVDEYPTFSLLIFGSHNLQNSCTTIFISYLGGYVAGLNLACSLCSLGYFLGVDVNPTWVLEAKCTWHGWLCDTHVASSASWFSKWALPATGMSYKIPEVCTNPAPHLAITVPGNVLNASLCNSSIQDVGFWWTGISGILLCCSWTFSRIACCFPGRVERHLISSDWDLISLACWRCKCDRTKTWVQWAHLLFDNIGQQSFFALKGFCFCQLLV